jgi:hypothetical protein
MSGYEPWQSNTATFTTISDPADEQLNGASPPAPTGVFAQVQQHWAEHAGRWQYDIAIPGTGGALVMRMGPVDGRTLAELGARADSKDPVSGLNANADLLIRGCTAILGREHPQAEPEPQINHATGGPYRVDVDLAAALGIPGVTTARQVLFGLFSGVPSPDLAIGAAADGYITWARGAEEGIAEGVMGESEAGGR